MLHPEEGKIKQYLSKVSSLIQWVLLLWNFIQKKLKP